MPDVLIVCTANMARSPLFAVRLQHEADTRLGEGRVTVGSAGIDALYGAPAAEGAARVSAGWGSSLDGHQAVPVTHHDLARIPLILVMERAHRRDLIARAPDIAARSFTVRELVKILGERLPPASAERLPDPADPCERLAAVAALAHAARPGWTGRRRLDVPDPIGAGQSTYDRLGAEFAEAATVMAPWMFGPDEA